jgi:hypothetical protein
VHSNFQCVNGIITTLEFAPSKVGGDFELHQCLKLVNLMGIPNEVGGQFLLRSCGGLKSTHIPLDSKFGSIKLIGLHSLPRVFDEFSDFPLLFKFQQYYDVWNTDGTLNKDGAKDFLDDAKEGLR